MWQRAHTALSLFKPHRSNNRPMHKVLDSQHFAFDKLTISRIGLKYYSSCVFGIQTTWSAVHPPLYLCRLYCTWAQFQSDSVAFLHSRAMQANARRGVAGFLWLGVPFLVSPFPFLPLAPPLYGGITPREIFEIPVYVWVLYFGHKKLTFKV